MPKQKIEISDTKRKSLETLKKKILKLQDLIDRSYKNELTDKEDETFDEEEIYTKEIDTILKMLSKYLEDSLSKKTILKHRHCLETYLEYWVAMTAKTCLLCSVFA